MVLTRNIINQNIIFKDYYKHNQNPLTYTFQELSSTIDACKNFILKNYKVEKGQSVLIGVRNPGKLQLALVFAFLELGVSLAIVDYERDDDFIDYNYIDPKTKLLLPIHYHVVTTTDHTKFKIFEKICNHTIILDDVSLDDFTPNNLILADNTTVIMRCTSSGTTGTPKIIEHTHEFIYELIHRNSRFYEGIAGYIFNLNHGSSPATYFFPTLCSAKIEKCVNFSWMSMPTVFKEEKLNHLLIPYSHQIDDILKTQTFINKELNLYTLSTIKRQWSEYVKNNKINNVISIFGSNETSGPVFLNFLNDKKFHENRFTKLDNFYDININEEGEILVTLPVYNKVIKTNDKFKNLDNYFYHLGRSDLLRINGTNVNKEKYDYLIKSKVNSDPIYDTVNNEIYLALWEEIPNIDLFISDLNQTLKSLSQNAHYISKFKVLNYNNFLTGIKVDHELLRDWFRNYYR